MYNFTRRFIVCSHSQWSYNDFWTRLAKRVLDSAKIPLRNIHSDRRQCVSNDNGHGRSSVAAYEVRLFLSSVTDGVWPLVRVPSDMCATGIPYEKRTVQLKRAPVIPLPAVRIPHNWIVFVRTDVVRGRLRGARVKFRLDSDWFTVAERDPLRAKRAVMLAPPDFVGATTLQRASTNYYCRRSFRPRSQTCKQIRFPVRIRCV